MTKLKGLLLTEGMHGMISQVEGLANALDLDFIHEKIELNNFWRFIPPKITPVQNFVFKNKIDEKFKEIIISKIPSARLGEPDDIANAVHFLASNQSNYINGETLHVNGGMYMA